MLKTAKEWSEYLEFQLNLLRVTMGAGAESPGGHVQKKDVSQVERLVSRAAAGGCRAGSA